MPLADLRRSLQSKYCATKRCHKEAPHSKQRAREFHFFAHPLTKKCFISSPTPFFNTLAGAFFARRRGPAAKENSFHYKMTRRLPRIKKRVPSVYVCRAQCEWLLFIAFFRRGARARVQLVDRFRLYS